MFLLPRIKNIRFRMAIPRVAIVFTTCVSLRGISIGKLIYPCGEFN